MEPLSYEIDVATRKVVVTFRAQPSIAQWRKTMGEIFQEPDYVPGYSVIMDHRQLSWPSKTQYIKQIVRFIDECHRSVGTGRWAIVTSEASAFGMGRMAEQLSEFEHSIRTFKDFAEAVRWVEGGL